MPYCFSKKNGPRRREDYPGDIHGENNLIILCSMHHKIIDDDPQKYTEEIVYQYKITHENNVRLQMNQGIPWKVNFSQLYYVNIPRIEMLAIQTGITFDETLPTGNACIA